ncbi:MAG: redoxin domain-containing protein [Acidobacteriota bacterium]
MAVEVGDMAPDFELKSHNGGKSVKLSDLRGKKNVFIAFYPLSFTPVCSAQIPSYEADLSRFAEYDTEVVAISVDSVPTHSAWAKSLGGISYDILADFEPKGAVAQEYGAYIGDKGFSERALFVVDKEGKIAYKEIHELGKQPDNEVIFDVLRKL